MKLSKLLDIFKQKDLINETTLERDFAVLREYTPMMFPLKSENDLRIAGIQFGDLRIGGNTTDDYLPYHTRDNKWLARDLNDLVKFMQKMERNEAKTEAKKQGLDLSTLAPAEQPKIRFSHVKKFVETDVLFDQERNAYEEDLVRAQIDFMLNDNQPNGLLMHSAYNPANNNFFVVKDFNPESIHKALNADKVFRDSVVKAMNNLGIAPHSIQAGIEKHDVWRDKMMTEAYYNHYPLPSENQNLVNEEGVDEVVNVMREGFKETWLRHRKGQYFTEHQDILNELRLTDMKVTDQEMQTLNEQVAWWENHYFSTVQSKQAQAAQKQNDNDLVK